MLEVRHVHTDSLKPRECNPRKNDHAVEAVATSIKEFGFNVPILCDQNMQIIAGHTRWKAAQHLGMEDLPVIIVEMTDTQRRAFSIADNKTAEIADWDLPRLHNILAELRKEDIDLSDLGFTDAELRKLLDDPLVRPEDVLPDAPLNPVTARGDVWHLGKHRLLCGDSREQSDVSLVCCDSQADHVLAGPPYFNQREYSHWADYQDYLADMSRVVKNCVEVLKPGGVIGWNIGNGSVTGHDHTSHHSRLLEAAGLRYVDTIAWVKSAANFGVPRNAHILRNRCYYPAFQWEAVLIFQKPGGPMPKMSREGANYMADFQTNVWEIPAVIRQEEAFGHPAVCPVELPYRAILAYTGDGATVFEPFGGSGTTLIAADKASRRALLIEQHPKYCERAVKRWEGVTGTKAARKGPSHESQA